VAKSNGSVIRGDVVLCDLNPVISTEQSGIRPVIIIQIDRANLETALRTILGLL
jgi:mRNA interferase MazF